MSTIETSENYPTRLKCIRALRPNANIRCKNDNITLMYEDPDNLPHPTEQEINEQKQTLLANLPINILRGVRNKMLSETDKYGLTDYPFETDEKKQQWIEYRQQLRDLPNNNPNVQIVNNELVNVNFPNKPE